MMDMNQMMGGGFLGGLLMILLIGAAIAALIALTVYLVRRSR
jgi:hypothetical protein